LILLAGSADQSPVVTHYGPTLGQDASNPGRASVDLVVDG
jgi:hypothetical protein